MQVHHDKNFMLSGFAKFRPEIYNEQTHVGARTTDSCCYENVLNDKVMVFEEPSISDSARYPITAAAKVLGICPHTLRTHLRAGRIRCSFNAKGRKVFTGKELKRYWRNER